MRLHEPDCERLEPAGESLALEELAILLQDQAMTRADPRDLVPDRRVHAPAPPGEGDEEGVGDLGQPVLALGLQPRHEPGRVVVLADGLLEGCSFHVGHQVEQLPPCPAHVVECDTLGEGLLPVVLDEEGEVLPGVFAHEPAGRYLGSFRGRHQQVIGDLGHGVELAPGDNVGVIRVLRLHGEAVQGRGPALAVDRLGCRGVSDALPPLRVACRGRRVVLRLVDRPAHLAVGFDHGLAPERILATATGDGQDHDSNYGHDRPEHPPTHREVATRTSHVMALDTLGVRMAWYDSDHCKKRGVSHLYCDAVAKALISLKDTLARRPAIPPPGDQRRPSSVGYGKN